jgi:hypothetical protein
MQPVLILTRDFGHKANGENMARRRHDRLCESQAGEPVPQQQSAELVLAVMHQTKSARLVSGIARPIATHFSHVSSDFSVCHN